MKVSCRASIAPRSQQGGAVLYVALIVLLLLAMIGIIGMQVTGMQERMSADYRGMNVAFQNAESRIRSSETAINQSLWDGGLFRADDELCTPGFDPQTWALKTSATVAEATHTRRIDRCFSGSSIKQEGPENSPRNSTNNIYQITSKAGDQPTDAESVAVIDTVFIP